MKLASGPARAAALALSVILTAACGASGSGRRSSPTTAGSAAPPAGSGASSAPVAGTPVHWVACQGPAGPAGYQCATIAVPRNPRNPAQGTIGMALDRRPASGHKIGSLLINPGGPGVSGVDFLPAAVGYLNRDLLAHFDVIGFDPPGVGRTAPVTCLDSAGLEKYYSTDPVPSTPGALASYLDEFRTFDAGCQQRSGAELPYVSTVDAAMDMDVIRRDVGDAGLSYLGFSYGTLLGATYAGLYPTRVRAMVLDGAIDPALPVIKGLDVQSAALEGDLDSFFSWCAAHSSCQWKPGPDPVGTFQAMLNRVRSSPLPVQGTSRTVGAAALLYGTAWGLYSTTVWPFLGSALAQAAAGDGTEIMQLFDSYTGRQKDGSYTNEFEANTAVNCLDAPAPSVSSVEAAAPAARAAAPVFGVANLYSEMACSLWPVPATGRPGPIAATGSPPIVVVGTTGDPATPYSEAQALASELAKGVLLTRVGEGHTAYPYSACVRSAVDAYLIDLTVPRAGTRCPTG
ncbi:MAG TPA: alpha/beta hydrolase [Acidimicrobiales bacterium]|nr:alpha/beta hydrolase [Acidimicrobiales bacterium]